jgi:hypothetical protein
MLISPCRVAPCQHASPKGRAYWPRELAVSREFLWVGYRLIADYPIGFRHCENSASENSVCEDTPRKLSQREGLCTEALRCSKEQNALHTLIHQRHLTPSCGGHAPTAERTLNPARMFTESLTSGPELENSQGHSLPTHPAPVSLQVRNGLKADLAGKVTN